MKTFLKNNLDIFITLFFIALVAGLGSLFVNLGLNWYSSLKTPTEWIPSIVIPILWSTIYVSFAIICSILLKKKLLTKDIITLGIINGVLNILWCLIFFTLNQLLIGNIIIIINAFFATILLVKFIKINKWYVNLLWLYPIWLYLATSFNLALWILN